MDNFQALVFDVDGTLADTERDGHRVAFNAAFAAAGLDWQWSPERYGELLAITGGKERIRYFIDRHQPRFDPPEDLAAFIVDLHQAKTREYTGMLARSLLPLRPGVLRLLQEARTAGLRLAIATTTTPANVTALLAHTLPEHALDWFEVIGAGDVVAAKKPAPDIYSWVLERLALPAAACLALEDSENGLRAALAAGLPTVITCNDYTRAQDFSGALLVADQFGEPESPMQVMAGEADGSPLIDVALLRKLHTRAA